MEYAIVTVRTKDGAWEADMELPAKMKLKNVAIKVLDTVKALDADRFEEATLADYQIWDGSILVMDQQG